MITNRVLSKVRTQVSPTLSILYRPANLQWSYSHHASLCRYRGLFHAIWSNGVRDEDDLGQRVLHATSSDGIHWSAHRVLFPSQAGGVLTACGLYDNGQALVAYAGSYVYDPMNVDGGHYITINDQHRATTLLAKTTVDGIVWGDTTDLKLPIIANHGPQRLHSGRLLLSGSVTFPHTDQADGLTGWQVRGLEPCPWTDMYDDSEGLMRHIALRGDGVMLCEGSFFQTDDQAIHMLLRSDRRKLYETVSLDDGETWSPPQETDFTDCGTKFHAGRLPDGRYFIVGSPDPAGARCPLVISLSRDGQVFDREFVIDGTYRPLRHAGKYKGGIYGYPHTMIHGDTFYVICSVNKEDIHVYTFPLSALNA